MKLSLFALVSFVSVVIASESIKNGTNSKRNLRELIHLNECEDCVNNRVNINSGKICAFPNDRVTEC